MAPHRVFSIRRDRRAALLLCTLVLGQACVTFRSATPAQVDPNSDWVIRGNVPLRVWSVPTGQSEMAMCLASEVSGHVSRVKPDTIFFSRINSVRAVAESECIHGHEGFLRLEPHTEIRIVRAEKRFYRNLLIAGVVVTLGVAKLIANFNAKVDGM